MSSPLHPSARASHEASKFVPSYHPTAADPSRRFAATSTANTMICCGSLSTEAFPRKPTISSSAIMSTEENSLSRPSASCSPTRSSIPRTSSSYGVTTNARPSTASTASTMSVNAGIISSCGRHLRIASTVFLLPPSLMRRSSLCTEASAPT